MKDDGMLTDPVIQSVLDERKIQRWGEYTIGQFSMFKNIDESTAKRWIKRGLIQTRKNGPRGVRIPGWVIAKAIAYGVEERRKSKTKFEGVDRRKSA